MKHFFIISHIIFSIILAQKPSNLPTNQKLENTLKKCKILYDTDDYLKLRIEAEKGIALSSGNNLYLSKFYFYKGYAFEFNNNQYKNASLYFEKSLKYAKISKNLMQETLALMRLNYMYYSIKEDFKRKKLIEYIKTIVDTTKNNEVKAILNGSIGEYYLDKSAYENFILYKLKAIEYRKLLSKQDKSNKDNIGISYLQIAGAYNNMKQYEKAIEYCNYSQNYVESTNGLAFLFNTYLESYVQLKDIVNSNKYYTKIYDLAEKETGIDLNLSFANRCMAEYYLEKKQPKIAGQYAEKALLFAKKSNDEEIEMEANAIKGRVLFQSKDYKNAIARLRLALKSAYVFDKNYYVEINKELAQSNAALNLWQQAYLHLETYSIVNDSILIESGNQSIANAEAKFQNKNKQQEINTLFTQNTIKNLEIEATKKQKYYLIAGLFLLAIIGSLLFYQSRNRRKTNEKLQILNENLDLKNTELDQANKAKTRFFSILNHDLRGPVANLVFFLQLQKESPELLDEESTKRMQDKTMAGAENLLNSMEDILQWSKSQMENFKPQPKNILVETLFEEIKNHFSSEEKVKITFENPNNIQITTDENYLKTIIRNLTGNAIKALVDIENSTIIWKTWQEKNEIFLSISDNVKGASNEQFKALYDEKEVVGIKTGLGLHLIRDLAKASIVKLKLNLN